MRNFLKVSVNRAQSSTEMRSRLMTRVIRSRPTCMMLIIKAMNSFPTGNNAVVFFIKGFG